MKHTLDVARPVVRNRVPFRRKYRQVINNPSIITIVNTAGISAGVIYPEDNRGIVRINYRIENASNLRVYIFV